MLIDSLIGISFPFSAEEILSFAFKPEEYVSFMKENPMLRFTFMAMVNSGQTYAKQVVVSIDE